MNRQVLSKKKLPDAPGVYFFLTTRRDADRNADARGLPRKGDVLYIGRATSLKSRVRSYFGGRLTETRGPWLAKVLGEMKGIDFRKTDSVLEAILLEADLIKKFQPPYNAIQKDDKSFNCIVITQEEFPRVLLVRSKDMDWKNLQLTTYNLQLRSAHGPYPYGLQLREAIKIIRRIFPWRDSCTPCARAEETRTQRRSSQTGELRMQRVSAGCKPCFNRQLGLCPGVCTGEMRAAEYRKHIRRMELFLSGKKARIVRELEREMRRSADEERFEKAGEYKRQLFALKHIQDIALLKRDADLRRYEDADTRGYVSSSARIGVPISEHQRFRVEGYDLSHFGGKEIVGAMTVVENGRAVPSEYRLFKIRGLRGANEPAGMQEIIRRRFTHPEWPLPRLIVVDGGLIQKRAAELALRGAGQSIPVVAVVKDQKHRPRDTLGFTKGMDKAAILLSASEAHRFVLKFQRKRRHL